MCLALGLRQTRGEVALEGDGVANEANRLRRGVLRFLLATRRKRRAGEIAVFFERTVGIVLGDIPERIQPGEPFGTRHRNARGPLLDAGQRITHVLALRVRVLVVHHQPERRARPRLVFASYDRIVAEAEHDIVRVHFEPERCLVFLGRAEAPPTDQRAPVKHRLVERTALGKALARAPRDLAELRRRRGSRIENVVGDRDGVLSFTRSRRRRRRRGSGGSTLRFADDSGATVRLLREGKRFRVRTRSRVEVGVAVVDARERKRRRAGGLESLVVVASRPVVLHLEVLLGGDAGVARGGVRLDRPRLERGGGVLARQRHRAAKPAREPGQHGVRSRTGTGETSRIRSLRGGRERARDSARLALEHRRALAFAAQRAHAVVRAPLARQQNAARRGGRPIDHARLTRSRLVEVVVNARDGVEVEVVEVVESVESADGGVVAGGNGGGDGMFVFVILRRRESEP